MVSYKPPSGLFKRPTCSPSLPLETLKHIIFIRNTETHNFSPVAFSIYVLLLAVSWVIQMYFSFFQCVISPFLLSYATNHYLIQHFMI